MRHPTGELDRSRALVTLAPTRSSTKKLPLDSESPIQRRPTESEAAPSNRPHDNWPQPCHEGCGGMIGRWTATLSLYGRPQRLLATEPQHAPAPTGIATSCRITATTYRRGAAARHGQQLALDAGALAPPPEDDVLVCCCGAGGEAWHQDAGNPLIPQAIRDHPTRAAPSLDRRYPPMDNPDHPAQARRRPAVSLCSGRRCQRSPLRRRTSSSAAP